MDVIASIDLLAGQVVRLRKGRYDEVTVYSDDPAAVVAPWSKKVPRVHVVDLDGAREGRAVQTDIVRSVVQAFGPGVQIGGGVRSLAAVESYFDLGVDRVVIGTAAVKDPALVREACARHPGRIVVALDARNGRVSTEGWTDDSERLALDVARSFAGLSIAALLYTDIERDGTEVGPNVAATADLARDGGFPVIASGGVGTLAHLADLASHPGIAGAIIGRALHEKRFSLEEAVGAARQGGSI